MSERLDAARPPRVLGLFDHAGIRRRCGNAASPSDVPGPYRVDLLMDQGMDLIPIAPARNRLHRKLRDVVEHRTDVRVDLAIRGVGHAARADVVLCMLEDKAELPAMLRRRSLWPYSAVPLVVVSCWWAEEIVHGTMGERARIARVVSEVDKILVFSRNQIDAFELIGAAHKVVPITFGVDQEWYRPEQSRRPTMQVAAMGIDRGRDYDTLMAAARLTPDIQYDVFTQPGRVDDPPPNVRLHAPTSMAEHRDNLRAADLIVVPTHDLAYPSGQSVLLEAMSCGRCTAATHTRALSEYIDDGHTNLALPLYDPAGVADVVRRAMSDPAMRSRVGRAAREKVTQEFTFQHTWAQAADVLASIAR